LRPGLDRARLPGLQLIYLYKPPQRENITNTWIYYRIASVDAVEPGGTLFAPMQARRVSWPTFEDVPPMIDTPGITGLESAHEHQCRLLKEQWAVEHEQSVVIGLLP
jgi:hypothetical protein